MITNNCVLRSFDGKKYFFFLFDLLIEIELYGTCQIDFNLNQCVSHVNQLNS